NPRGSVDKSGQSTMHMGVGNVNAISLRDKLATFSEHWSPKIVGELNGQYVKLVKFKGEYVWYHHAHEDEMFLVIEGQFDLHFREGVGSAVRTSSASIRG